MEPDHWANIVGLIQAVSAFAVACVAIWGINAWRREQLGKRRAELAEDVLALFYEAERAIGSIRSPLGYSGESKSRQRGENESKEGSEILDRAYVIIEQYNAHAELFSKIRAMRFRFMALFGRDAARPFEELRRIEIELAIASRNFAHNSLKLEDGSLRWYEDEHYLDKIHKAEAVFFEGLRDPDPINPKLNAVIASIEDTCRKAIGVRQ